MITFGTRNVQFYLAFQYRIVIMGSTGHGQVARSALAWIAACTYAASPAAWDS